MGLIDPVESTHPIFTGVAQLYYDFGNPVSALSNPNSTVLELNTAGVGLIGLFDDVDTSSVPEPGSVLLLALGPVGATLLRIRAR